MKLIFLVTGIDIHIQLIYAQLIPPSIPDLIANKGLIRGRA